MSFAFWTSSVIVSMFSFQQPVWLQWMSASSAHNIRRGATWLPTYYLVILPMVVVGFIGIFTLPELARPDTVALQLALAQMLPAFIGIFLWPRASRAGVLCGLLAGFTVTALFTLVWRNPLGVHAGFWGLVINLPLFVAVSLKTAPTSRRTLERFMAITAPGRGPGRQERAGVSE